MALTWTPQSSPGAVAGIVCGIAASSAGTICQAFNYLGDVKIYRSTDGGVSWTLVEAYPGAANTGASPVACDGSVFLVSVFTSNEILRSTDDGLTWNPVPSSLTGNVPSFAYTGTGTWLAFSTSGTAAKSVDGGASWSPVTTPASGVPFGFWDGSQFVMTAGTKHLFTSPDGVTWTDTGGFSNNFGGNAVNVFAKQGSRYLAGLSVGGYLTYTTPPPSGWPPGTPTTILSLDPSGRTYVMGGAGSFTAADHNTGGPLFASSLDGVTWALDTITPNGVFAVGTFVPNKSIFIFASDNGHIFTSDVIGTIVPDVTGDTLAAASIVITGAGFTVGALTYVVDGVVSIGHVVSQSPVGGASAGAGAPIALALSLGASTVPNIVGLTVGAGTTVLTSNSLVLGSTLSVFNPTVTIGLIISQTPAPGSVVAPSTAVNVIVSLGPQPILVPDVVGLTAAAARTAITGAGLVVGTTLPVVTEATPIGSVASQSPLSGTVVAANSLVNIAVAVFLEPFDLERTVISQYANSPVLLRLVNNMQQYIDPRANFEAFYNFVWNIDTAVGFGLDIWGRIIGVSRLLQLASSETPFGFENADFPYDWQNFGGGTFRITGTGTAYVLPDDAYRVLLLTKALANIVATTAPALNQLLQNLFPNRGPAYVVDNGGMDITFTFGFPLSVVELAILTQSGALPHPAGVSFNVVVVP